jgi:hypothetical protein
LERISLKDFRGSLRPHRFEIDSEITENINKFYDNIQHGIKEAKIDYNIASLEHNLYNTLDFVHRKILEQCGNVISRTNDSVLLKNYREKYRQIGIELETHRKYSTELLTTSGILHFERHVLRPVSTTDREALFKLEGRKTVIPLDKFLKIDNLPFKITPHAMLMIAWWATEQLSYQKGAYILEKLLKCEISDETVRQVTNYVGKLVIENDMGNAEILRNQLDKGQIHFSKPSFDGILYIMADGAMIHTKEKDENGLKWRENKLAIIFSSKDMRVKPTKTDDLNYIIDKREYVDYFGGVDKFQMLLFYAAIRNGYGDHTKTVMVTDGATWIANMKSLLFPDAIHILDFWHVTQHLYDFGKIYYHQDEAKYNPWVEEMKDKLVHGEHINAIIDIEKMENDIKNKNFKGLNKEEKSKIGNLSKYLRSHIDNINYLEYRAQGLYIGSGHIESGNRTVAQERLKRPGMTWNIDSGQYLLTLRAKNASNLWHSDVEEVLLTHFNLLK